MTHESLVISPYLSARRYHQYNKPNLIWTTTLANDSNHLLNTTWLDLEQDAITSRPSIRRINDFSLRHELRLSRMDQNPNLIDLGLITMGIPHEEHWKVYERDLRYWHDQVIPLRLNNLQIEEESRRNIIAEIFFLGIVLKELIAQRFQK